MKTIIHINQHKIRSNIKASPEDREPVITVKTYNSNTYANSVAIKDDYGKVIARIIHNQDKPLSCGAKCWIEVDSDNVRIE